MKFAISTKNEVLKFGEVRSSSSPKSLFATQLFKKQAIVAEAEAFLASFAEEHAAADLALHIVSAAQRKPATLVWRLHVILICLHVLHVNVVTYVIVFYI